MRLFSLGDTTWPTTTLHPKPYTRNPTPETLHPKPYTRSAKPGRVFGARDMGPDRGTRDDTGSRAEGNASRGSSRLGKEQDEQGRVRSKTSKVG